MFDQEKFQEERQRHLTYLNTVLGGFSITIALTCLSFRKAEIALRVCLPFIIGLAIIGYQQFPASLQLLRQRGKVDEAAKELAEYIEKSEYGKIALFRDCFPYIFGYSFYLLVLVKTDFFKSLFGL